MGIAHEGGRGGQSRDGGIEAHGEKRRKEGRRTAQTRGVGVGTTTVRGGKEAEVI